MGLIEILSKRGTLHLRANTEDSATVSKMFHLKKAPCNSFMVVFFIVKIIQHKPNQWMLKQKSNVSRAAPLTRSFRAPSKSSKEIKTWFPVVSASVSWECDFTVPHKCTANCSDIPTRFLAGLSSFGFPNQKHLLQRTASVICSRPFQLWPCEHRLQTLYGVTPCPA